MSKRRAKAKRREADSPAAKKRWSGWVLLATCVPFVAALAMLVRQADLRQERQGVAATDTSTTNQPEPRATHPVAASSDPLAAVTTRESQLRRAAEQRLVDPQEDGWSTEVLADRAKGLLSDLIKDVAQRGYVDVAQLRSVASAEFASTRLRPRRLIEVFRDPSITVSQQPAAEPADAHQGVSGLAAALEEFAEPLEGRAEIHTHVKIVRVAVESDVVSTTAFVETSGRSVTDSVGQHATWDCVWQRLSDDALRLRSIRASNYQEVAASGGNGVWFADCTESVLGKNRSFGEQMLHGLNHWLARIERVHGIHAFARFGLAVGDINADGLEDLYICQPGGLPNRLFVQGPDGTASDRSQESGVDWLDHTSSALLVDLDNDGAQDLVVATTKGLLVMENDSTGRFRRKATLPPADTDVQSLSAADYDNDGDLDLYVCMDFANLAALRNETPVGFVYHDANDGGANVLFRNDIEPHGRSWKFTDVTAETGLDVHNRRHSLAAAWEDYDNDGDQDLYVANDYGQNCLYRNDEGRFVDVAAKREVLDFGSGMSVSWGDYNRDGWMDLYVANMFSSAGNRITRQHRFRPHDDEQTRSVYSRFAKGNSLFASEEGRRFRELSANAGVEMGRWAWSSLFADLNNDGWEDLTVANGYITTEDTGDL